LTILELSFYLILVNASVLSEPKLMFETENV